jgi:exopolyphosphatase / guanosine-5'-triphosphate,3'-diphosphate pyrophosphatase
MIVPRWEWRAFGAELEPAERQLATMAAQRTEDSTETYLLSRGSDASVKLRAGRVDVKRRVDIAADGLERWLPVMKATFPMTAAEVRSVLSVLAAPAPPLDRAEYTLEQLSGEVLGGRPDLLALRVHKRRLHYTFAGCLAESTELAIPGRAARTIAVESEDPERVRAAVRALGVTTRPVVCVARGLKALAGFGAHRFAALDVGTNSVKLHVAERDGDGAWSDVADRAETTRLGEGLDATGRLGAAAIERTTRAIGRLAAEARADGVDAIAAVGTAGLRDAANADELLERVRERCTLDLEVLSSEDEARLAYLAATEALGPAPGTRLVFDSGGGSSQFTFGRGARVEERFSLEVGAVRMTERYGLAGAVTADVLATALAGIAGALSRLRDRSPPATVAGLGGTVTNLAAVQHGLVEYDPAVIEGTTLDQDEIDRQIALYRARTAEQRRTIAGLQTGRAEVILAGACIVRTVLGLLEADTVTVSTRGLRHGLLAARFGVPGQADAAVTATIPKEEPV